MNYSVASVLLTGYGSGTTMCPLSTISIPLTGLSLESVSADSAALIVFCK